MYGCRGYSATACGTNSCSSNQEESGKKNTAPFQYALSTRAGCECIAHALQALTDQDPQSTIKSVDGIGAYDTISRNAMLRRLRHMEGGEAILPFVLQFYGAPSTHLWEAWAVYRRFQKARLAEERVMGFREGCDPGQPKWLFEIQCGPGISCHVTQATHCFEYESSGRYAWECLLELHTLVGCRVGEDTVPPIQVEALGNKPSSWLSTRCCHFAYAQSRRHFAAALPSVQKQLALPSGSQFITW